MRPFHKNAVAQFVADSSGPCTRIDIDNQVFGMSSITIVPLRRDEVCCRLLSVFMDEDEGRIARNRDAYPSHALSISGRLAFWCDSMSTAIRATMRRRSEGCKMIFQATKTGCICFTAGPAR